MLREVQPDVGYRIMHEVGVVGYMLLGVTGMLREVQPDTSSCSSCDFTKQNKQTCKDFG